MSTLLTKDAFKIQGWIFLILSVVSVFFSYVDVYFFDDYVGVVGETKLYVELGFSTFSQWEQYYLYDLYIKRMIGFVALIVSLSIYLDYTKNKNMTVYTLSILILTLLFAAMSMCFSEKYGQDIIVLYLSYMFYCIIFLLLIVKRNKN